MIVDFRITQFLLSEMYRCDKKEKVLKENMKILPQQVLKTFKKFL